MPGSKRPGELRRGEWIGKENWREEYSRRLPSRFEIQVWSNSTAGVGVVTGPGSKHLVAVDIDTDDKEIFSAIVSALPGTTVRKRGAKGETLFYRGPDIADSKSWNRGVRPNQERLCDLIGPGRQTVLPPTIHSDTNQPYMWTGPDALEDVDAADLPELTPEHIEAIGEALKSFGWQSDPERPARNPSKGGDNSGGPWKRLNDKAIRNLHLWIPELDLYRCRPTRAGGYEAVAIWRASNTGRPIEKRKLNLKIHPDGITDFGDGPRGYSPIDVVMAAQNKDFNSAYEWLEARVDNDVVIDLKPKMLRGDVKQPARYRDLNDAEVAAATREQDIAVVRGRDESIWFVPMNNPEIGKDGVIAIFWRSGRAPGLAGEEFDEPTLRRLIQGFVFDDDSPVEQPDYLVKGLIPPREVAFVGGQSGSGKTFIALYLSTSLASGQPFFGRAVKQPVGVAILAAEGAGTYKHRLRVARQHAVGDQNLPICYLGQVPNMADEKEVRALVPRLKAVSQFMTREYKVRLGAVIIDTLAAAFDLNDENDNSEAARSIRNLRYLAQQVDALMIPVHHYGKGIGTGLRGASGWKGGCDAVISVLADRDEVSGNVSRRELALAKSRDYPEGPISPFTLTFVSLGTDEDGEEFGSCYVEPELTKPSTITTAKKAKREPESLIQFRTAFEQAVKKGCTRSMVRENGAKVNAVRLSDVRDQFSKSYPADESDPNKRRDAVRQAFKRASTKAISTDEFGLECVDDVEWVWAVSGRCTVIIDLDKIRAAMPGGQTAKPESFEPPDTTPANMTPAEAHAILWSEAKRADRTLDATDAVDAST
jgi:hypothetical protein